MRKRSIAMKPLNRDMHARRYVFLAVGIASLIALAVVFWMGAPLAARNGARPEHSGEGNQTRGRDAQENVRARMHVPIVGFH